MKKILALLIAMPLSVHATDLCRKGEFVEFSCETGKEIISICASSNVTQYRSKTISNLQDPHPFSANLNEKLFYSVGRASKYHEQHLRFVTGERIYLVFDRWNNDSQGKSTNTRGILIYKLGALPSEGERAEFNAEYLVETKTCSRSTGIVLSPATGKRSNVEQEDFLHIP